MCVYVLGKYSFCEQIDGTNRESVLLRKRQNTIINFFPLKTKLINVPAIHSCKQSCQLKFLSKTSNLASLGGGQTNGYMRRLV